MTGYADYNFPAFHAAAARLRADGWAVINPAESFDGDQGLDYETYLRHDIEQVLAVDAVACLEGWQAGTGARLEVAVALAVGLPVYTVGLAGLQALFPAKAGREVLGAHLRLGEIRRDQHWVSYANALESFLTKEQVAKATAIANGHEVVAESEPETILQEAQRLVHGDRGEAYGHPLDDFTKTAQIWSAILGIEVRPEQVPLCMVGVKISREVNAPKRDNRTDGAGYFETLDMVHAEKARRGLA